MWFNKLPLFIREFSEFHSIPILPLWKIVFIILKWAQHHIGNPNFEFINGDLITTNKMSMAFNDIGFVFHVAANPDMKLGTVNTKVNFEQKIPATCKNKVTNIVFASTSTVYGEAEAIPTSENNVPLYQYHCTVYESLHLKHSSHPIHIHSI